MATRNELAVRHSIAPRVLDNTVPMSTLTSTARFSVRVAPPSQIKPQNGVFLDAVQPLAIENLDTSEGPILATFVWKDRGARVQLAGSFDDWRKHDMTYVPGVAYFLLVVELPPGEYFYRFVVDGRWAVAEDDHNLREDQFGEWSHFLVINSQTLKAATPNRFSTAAISRVNLPKNLPAQSSSDQKTLQNEQDDDFHDESVDSEAEQDDTDTEHNLETNAESSTITEETMERLPRQRGEEYVNDYDEDPCGEYDLQADVFEAMVDVKEAFTESESRALLFAPTGQRSVQTTSRKRRNPTKKLFRQVFSRLFGKDMSVDSSGDNLERDDAEQNSRGRFKKQVIGVYGRRGYSGLTPISEEVLRMRGLPVEAAPGRKKRLRVWFPNERTFPTSQSNGRKMEPHESEQVIDNSSTALRFNLAEENANNRQMLGKTLFAQGKYDAALALFSLSVKIREDNGLRNAKTTAVAHTDVASAFIHLNDTKNAEKHLKTALAVFEKGAFSGGKPQLGDVHCFLGVVFDMKGNLGLAEGSYRIALSLYEEAGAVRNNPNYSTAKDNLKDNLRRQKESPVDEFGDISDINTISTSETLQYSGSDSSMQRINASTSPHATSSPGAGNAIVAGIRSAFERRLEKENMASQMNILRQTKQTGIPPFKSDKPGPTPQTLSTVGSFPDSESSSLGNSRLLDPAALACTPIALSSKAPLPPALEECRRTAELNPSLAGQEQVAAGGSGRRRSSRPTTWKALADVARASMPTTPLEPDSSADQNDAADTAALGSYEEMSRGWQRDGRTLLIEANYSEAIDMYTLAIYTRKRHGPWFSKANAETHVEYARALFAINDVKGASEALRDAIAILEKLNDSKHYQMLGDVWGNLGCALDRLGGHQLDAESAHCAGLVAYGRSGMSKDDPMWNKAWRNLCVNVKAQGSKGKSINDIWTSIDMQTRGKIPVTRAGNVKIHV